MFPRPKVEKIVEGQERGGHQATHKDALRESRAQQRPGHVQGGHGRWHIRGRSKVLTGGGE